MWEIRLSCRLLLKDYFRFSQVSASERNGFPFSRQPLSILHAVTIFSSADGHVRWVVGFLAARIPRYSVLSLNCDRETS